MAFFSRMAMWSRPAIGLDIGTRMVKAVQLKRKGKGIELEKCGMAEIYPSGEKPTEPEAQRRAIVEAIRKALGHAQIDARTAVSAVAGESIIVRYIQLPEMSEAELKNALKWEAEEYIPFRIDDVNIDSAIIGHSGQGDMRRMDVLLACARKDLINDHVALIREAGLGPVTVDVDSFAFLNCYEMNYDTRPGEVVGLVNIGGDITCISVYSDGTPKFSRDISIGGNTITSTLQQRLEIGYPQAEALKVARGALRKGGATPAPAPEPPPPAFQEDSVMDTIRSTIEAMTGASEAPPTLESQADRVILSTLNNLVGEIRRSVQFFENQSRGLTVGRLVLGGGGANLTGLDAFISREMKLPVEIIDPLLRIPVTGAGIDADFLRESKHMLSVGIGLALRKVVD